MYDSDLLIGSLFFCISNFILEILGAAAFNEQLLLSRFDNVITRNNLTSTVRKAVREGMASA